MLLIAIGKLRQGPERALFERYAARLRPALQLREIGEATGPVAEIKRRESAAMLAALPPAAFVVALDPEGESVSSPGLAAKLEAWRITARSLVFLIGGAEGIGDPALHRADAAIALGPMIWPHMLARVMLAEQLYRAQCILSGHPYHRGG